jgi:preprotein translocase subunit SecA
MIGQAIEDAVEKYVTEDYIAATISEWARGAFEVNIDPYDMRGLRRFEDVEEFIKRQARTEVETNLGSTLQEFMGEEPEDNANWDTKGLSSWAMSRFHVQISQSQLRKMDAHEVEEKLKEAALEQIEKRDCAEIVKYLEQDYALKQLCNWAEEKFNIKVAPEELIQDAVRRQPKPAEEIVEIIQERARAAYGPREVEYPVDQSLAYAFGDMGTPEYAAGVDFIRAWAMAKYRIDIPAERIRSLSMRKLRDELIGYQEQFLKDGRLEQEVDALISANPQPEMLAKAMNTRFALAFTQKDVQSPLDIHGNPCPVREMLIDAGRRYIRKELTDLEQFVLIHIFDQSWKDHLYAMDLLKNSIGLQAFAEKDPRIAYKKEGYRYFQEMMAGIRDKVTDLIFRARITGAPPQAQSAYRVTETRHETEGSYGVGETIAADPGAGGSEMAQAAAETQGEGAKVKTIVRETPKVGRNDPCPCGSGKKYKKCCGQDVA